MHRRTAQKHRSPRRPILLFSLWLAGCATTPPQEPDPDGKLGQAEAEILAGQPQACLDQLTATTVDAFPKRLRDRYDLAIVRAHVALGQHWDAFETAELFPERYPHSELRPTIVELQWEMGRALAASGRGFLFFWSDRRGARTVLEHLITRHPDSPRLADALRLLGDMAYEDGDYELAQERFRDLLRRRPESEWAVYARFRFAMSIVASLQGPDYDLDRMMHAERELRDFLAQAPENPEFVATASGAVATLLEWQAERHLRIAHFYRRVGNQPGEQLHLEIARDPRFRDTNAHAQANTEYAGLVPAGGASPTEAGR